MFFAIEVSAQPWHRVNLSEGVLAEGCGAIGGDLDSCLGKRRCCCCVVGIGIGPCRRHSQQFRCKAFNQRVR